MTYRILLADDSPHAQRMGERILREEGFDVVTVADGETALLRLPDIDPDLILADVFLPRKNGYQICEFVKSDPRYRHAKVILTAGALEPVDETEATRVAADALLKKPFEASVVLNTIKPLVEEAQYARGLFGAPQAPPAPPAAVGAIPAAPALPLVAGQVDPERVRAAITLALDAALPAMIDEITERVLVALGH